MTTMVILIRFWKGVLPSNTLNVLHGLTEDVKERRVFGALPIEVTTFDETAEKVPIKQNHPVGPRTAVRSFWCA